ncbi:MAG: Asp-tRNA(Asn)/Glu-tRNA(Gln) amidotransferase subunit GatA [Bacilli bacterium]|nr:Asp-tRNA(Asn)/Glu-tRNA(Gln) amidotransferase subunit GatA [Bacilli bacterium]
MTNYLSLSLDEIHSKLINKEIKPLDLVLEAFDKIEKNKDLNAFITLNKESAIEEAKRLEEQKIDGLLFGIPIAIKDNIVTKNLKTTCASRMLENFEPIYDATVIEKIKANHMIIIGKTNMDEFAMGSTGETSYFGNILNPWDLSKVPGGSSSGSAAAVSARITPFALGSDTGGSIRQPSSFCGVVGMKPTYGRVSRYGLIAFASSLDHIGPITRNVYENALLLEAISGKDNNDLTSSNCSVPHYVESLNQEIKGLKIGVPNYYMSETINEEVRSKMKEIIALLENMGCNIEFLDIDYLECAIPLYQVIALGEASSNLARYDGIRFGHATNSYHSLEEFYKKTRSEGFGNEVKRRLMIGSYVLSGKNANIYYEKALKIRGKMVDSFKDAFTKYDLLIGPTNTDVAYPLGTKQDDALKSFYDDLLTIPLNMAGLPALSLPVGFNHDYMPIGMQIIGNYFQEETIYKLASAVEKALNLDLESGKKC